MNIMQDALLKAGFITEEDVKRTEEEKKGRKKKQEKKQWNPWECLKEATPRNPVFVNLTIKDRDYNDYEDYDKKYPIWKGVVACEGVEAVEFEENKMYTRKKEMAIFRGIQKGTNLNEGIQTNRRLEPIHNLLLGKKDISIHKILEPTKELMDKYKNVKNQIYMTIKTKVYPTFEAPKNKEEAMKDFDEYMEFERKMNKVLDNPLKENTYKVKGLSSWEDAEKWLLKNHPEEAISFSYRTNSGNFGVKPVIHMVSDKSFLGTQEERNEYLKELSQKYNIKTPFLDPSALQKEEKNARGRDNPRVKEWSPKTAKSKNPKKGRDKEEFDR